jgi:hypothetical protein
VSVRVNEVYKDWKPPKDYLATTGSLLAAIPERYLAGLEAVVLTNSGALSHDRRRSKTRSRQRKVPVLHCLGLYHPARAREAAWIEVFVDRVVDGLPRFIRAFALARELDFARTLYHEIGHHIHATQVPEYREREDVADTWRDRLYKEMFRRRHPYLRLLLRPLRPLFKLLSRIARWRLARLKAKTA